MIMYKNPFGSDELDIIEESEASRIGRRIRRIRMSKGLSQTELGALVGLTGDRIQKYENGARKPKNEMLKQIARALGVSSLALADPNTSSYVGAMFALFELENIFNMKVDKVERGMCVKVDFKDELYQYLKEWYDIFIKFQADMEAAPSEEEKNEIMKSYYDWEWSFPQGIVNQTSREVQKKRLKDKIDELQAVYKKLDEE